MLLQRIGEKGCCNMQRLIDVKRDDACAADDLIPTGIAFTRWQVRFMGLHCLTVYRHDIHVTAQAGSNDAAMHLRHWWLYPAGEWGVGIHVPGWVACRLGLSESEPC